MYAFSIIVPIKHIRLFGNYLVDKTLVSPYKAELSF